MIATSPRLSSGGSTPTAGSRLARLVSPASTLLPLIGAGALLQLSWLLLWPASYRLTHGTSYTFSYLAEYPLVRQWVQALLAAIRQLSPGFEYWPDLQVFGLVAVFTLAGLSYLAALILLDRGLGELPGAFWLVVALTLVFQVTLFFMPGLLTTDIFSYVMYGDIPAWYGGNPYIDPPAAFPNSPVLPWIHPTWQWQPSVYGPIWTALSWALSRLTAGSSLVSQVIAYKVLMNVVHLVNLALVWWLLKRLRPDDGSRRARLTAFTVFAWNPLMLFDIAGNAHNDGLMVTLLLLSLVPLAWLGKGSAPSAARASAERPVVTVSAPLNQRWLLATLGVALSALVKYTTAVVGVFYLAAWMRQVSTWRARAACLAVAGAATLAVTALFAWPWLFSPAALSPLLQAAGGERYLNSVPELAAVALFRQLFDPNLLQPDAIDELARTWMKLITRATFALYLAWEVHRVWRSAGRGERAALEAIIRAASRSLLILILLVLTWILEWYFTWPLALATLLGWRSTLTKVVVAYTLTSLPVFYVHHSWQWQTPHLLIVLYATLPLALPLILWLRRPRAAVAGPRWSPAHVRTERQFLATASMVAMLATLLIAPLLATTSHAACTEKCRGARLITGSPSPGTVIGAAPDSLELLFSQHTLPTRTWVVVTTGAGDIVSGPASIDPSDNRRVTTPLAPGLPEGVYAVRWHTLTSDPYNELDGAYTFTVRSGAPSTPQVSLSRDQADIRQYLTVEGTGFSPRALVNLVLADDEQAIGSTRTDATGAFVTSIAVPEDIPLGLQPLTAADSNGVRASAALNVRWGGWPPLKLSLQAEAGPGPGEVTLTVVARNRSDYLLSDLRLLMPVPAGAEVVSISQGGTFKAGNVVWDNLGPLGRTALEPRQVTLRVGVPLTTQVKAEFHHEEEQRAHGDVLPAFASNAVSPPVTARPAP